MWGDSGGTSESGICIEGHTGKSASGPGLFLLVASTSTRFTIASRASFTSNLSLTMCHALMRIASFSICRICIRAPSRRSGTSNLARCVGELTC
jgi:hypothetical protein